MRKVVIAVVVLAILAGAAYILLSSKSERPTSGDGNPANAPKSSQTTVGTVGSTGSDSEAVAAAQLKFHQRKSEAMQKLHVEVERTLHTCMAPPQAGSAVVAPTPHTVAFDLEWDPAVSTPELQRYIVRGVSLLDAKAPVSPESMRCLDKIVGNTLNVLLPANELPLNAKHLREPLLLPLR